jgi:hypothetical protein
MKKIILMLFAVVVSCAAWAGDNYKITEGSLASLKNGGVASITIDMTNTQFDNKMPLREDGRFGFVDKDIPNYQSEFVREYNEHTKAFRMTNDASEANYKFLLEVTNLDVFAQFFSFKGGVATKIWGTLTILNEAGDKVAVITLTEFESSGFTYSISLEETFEVFAKNLAKRINKGK